MGLNIRLHNIDLENNFTLFYKTGTTLGSHVSGFSAYSIGANSGVIYTGSTYRDYDVNPIVFTGATFNTQYWFKFVYTGETTDTGYLIQNIYTHDSIYYGDCVGCCDIGLVVGGGVFYVANCAPPIIDSLICNNDPTPTNTNPNRTV